MPDAEPQNVKRILFDLDTLTSMPKAQIQKLRIVDSAELALRAALQSSPQGDPPAPRLYLDFPEGLLLNFEFEFDGSDFGVAVLREITITSGATAAVLASEISYRPRLQDGTLADTTDALAFMGALADGSAFARVIPFTRSPGLVIGPAIDDGLEQGQPTSPPARLTSWFRKPDVIQWHAAPKQELAARVAQGLAMVQQARSAVVSYWKQGSNVH